MFHEMTTCPDDLTHLLHPDDTRAVVWIRTNWRFLCRLRCFCWSFSCVRCSSTHFSIHPLPFIWISGSEPWPEKPRPPASPGWTWGYSHWVNIQMSTLQWVLVLSREMKHLILTRWSASSDSSGCRGAVDLLWAPPDEPTPHFISKENPGTLWRKLIYLYLRSWSFSHDHRWS